MTPFDVLERKKNLDDERVTKKDTTKHKTSNNTKKCEITLKDSVEKAMRSYFDHLEGQSVTDIYDMVISEVEAALFAITLKEVQGNKTKAAQILGLNRSTLRKKLERYEIS